MWPWGPARTHRRSAIGWQPADTARPGAGGQYDAVGFFDRAVFEQDAFDATALGDDIFHRLFFDDFGPRRLGGNAQRGSELAVIDLVVLRRKNRAGDFPGKAGFAPARVRCRKPLKRKRELPLKFQPVRNLGLIVRGQGEQQRAFRPQFDIDAAGALKFFGKVRPARLSLAAQCDQRLLARFGFAASGQHPGGRMARAHARFAAIENGHIGPFS